ncbi:MAG: hypothetical protein MMC23_005089 [Stictis urceolatum]|nr:hypothetical protein [Stictis urceolata]
MTFSPLSLTIRFSSSHPDLSLTLANPSQTSTLTLIQQIRTHLPSSNPSSTARIRLIYSGRVLPLTFSVTSALRLPPPPPRARPKDKSKEKEDTKGKAPLRPSALDSDTPPQPPRIYIHAHLSGPLSSSALNAERLAAHDADLALLPPSSATSPTSPTSPSSHYKLPRAGPSTSSAQNAAPTTTAPAPPIGFDRLLLTGLSQLEVASLRSQFVAQLAHTRTPDDMPSASELKVLEERWLDNDSPVSGFTDTTSDDSPGEVTPAGAAGGPLAGIRRMVGLGGGGAGGAAAAGAGAGAGGGGFLGDEDGGLEDMLWGNVVGFFWPVAAVVWLMREEGVWSQRRRVAVATGALVNFAFGVMRAAG